MCPAFLGLNVVMVILMATSRKRLRHGEGFRSPTPIKDVPHRSFRRFAVAIVIAAVVISASLLAYTSYEARIAVTTNGMPASPPMVTISGSAVTTGYGTPIE